MDGRSSQPVKFARARLELFRSLAEARERDVRRQLVVQWWVGLVLVPSIPAVLALLIAPPFHEGGVWSWLFTFVVVACVTYPLAALAAAVKWRPPFIDFGKAAVGDLVWIALLVNVPALTFLVGDVLAFLMRYLGPGLFLEAWRMRRIVRQLPQVDYDRLAIAMAQLYANEQGRVYEELIQPGESLHDVMRVVWYLHDCQWINVSMKQPRVWLRDDARKRLAKATGSTVL